MVRLRLLRALLATPIAVGALVVAPPALADALPPTACDANAKEGDSCTTAGNGDEDGVCETETCSHINYLPDGGFGPPVSYSCLLCELVDAGSPDAAPPPDDAGPPPTHDAGPPPVDAGPGPTTTDAGTASTATTQLASSSNCSVAQVGTGPQGSSWLFGLGTIGLVVSALSRRRRQG
jgi:MYXO-CTERM domain-containing protein